VRAASGPRRIHQSKFAIRVICGVRIIMRCGSCSERTVLPHSERLTVGRTRGSHTPVCIVRRMPRMQVYLPDDLYEQVKTRHLPASELLQDAVRAEVRRQDLLGETDTYLARLLAEVGQPSPQDLARAEAIARRIASQQASHAS
jgi:hypothetical protein